MNNKIETFITLVLGALIGFGTSYYFYKESGKDSEKQLNIIKNEFQKLHTQVKTLNLTSFSTEKVKEVNNISKSIESWIVKLEDLGAIENQIDKKILKYKLDEKSKSIIVRRHVQNLLEEIDNFVFLLNKNGKDIKWEKPKIHKDIWKHTSQSTLTINEKVRVRIELRSYANRFIIEIDNLDKSDSRLVFTFRLTTNNEISLSTYPINSYKAVIENKTRYIDYKSRFNNNEVLQKVFEYLLTKK